MSKDKKPHAEHAHVLGEECAPADWTPPVVPPDCKECKELCKEPLLVKVVGWRKVLCVAFIVGVAVGMEVFAKAGLSANMLELLKWLGISYLGANAIKGGMEGWRR